MDEAIDYNAVIMQLQIENEGLRRALGAFSEVHDTVYKIPQLLAHMWHKATANKYQLLIGVMIVYWIVTIALMLYDRFFV